MNYKLLVNYSLEIISTEDRRGDEPRIQIAFVTIDKNGRAKVQVPESGKLADNISANRMLRNLSLEFDYNSNEREDYLAIAARAIENDKSTSSNRLKDKRHFADIIRKAAQKVIDSGRLPNVNEIWLAANEPDLIDRRARDDDDKISVSARVYPTAGKEIKKNIHAFDEYLEFRFRGDGAHYLLKGRLTAEEVVMDSKLEC